MQWKGSTAGRKMGCMYTKNMPRCFIPNLFRDTPYEHFSPDEKPQPLLWISMTWSLKDIPRCGVAGASLLNEHTHRSICRVWSLAHRGFWVPFFLHMVPTGTALSKWEWTGVWQNVVQCRDRYPVETNISKKLWTNSTAHLTEMRWAAGWCQKALRTLP